MKKILAMLIMFMVAVVSTAMAQTSITVGANDFSSLFTTFATLVAAIPVVAHFILKILKKDSQTPNLVVQIVSWMTGLALTTLGWGLSLGFLADVTWYWALIYGFAAALAANGVADTKIIVGILSLFKKK